MHGDAVEVVLSVAGLRLHLLGVKGDEAAQQGKCTLAAIHVALAGIGHQCSHGTVVTGDSQTGVLPAVKGVLALAHGSELLEQLPVPGRLLPVDDALHDGVPQGLGHYFGHEAGIRRCGHPVSYLFHIGLNCLSKDTAFSAESCALREKKC